MVHQESRVTALVLQGGGALGAYQVGAYMALVEGGIEPDWVCGTSIGAINAALIVGNKPEDRIPRLVEFWHGVAWPASGFDLPLPTSMRRQLGMMDALRAFLFGQPNFFWPRLAMPFFALDGPADRISLYDPSPLRLALESLVDFDWLNARRQRLSLGAVRVTSGELVFFDNMQQVLASEHVMASGAMPPNFPGVRVGNELFWDGGCVSNTPLEAIYRDPSGGADLVFMVDLFEPNGSEPDSFDGIRNRKQDIDGASRSAAQVEWVVSNLNLQHALRRHLDGTPSAERALLTPQSERTLQLVQLCYGGPPYEASTKEHDFSHRSIEARIEQGHRDMQAVLAEAPWTKPHGGAGAVLHRRVTARNHQA
ncbi:MAG: patatin-like phospholipase family protein [Pseudomonadota bacterium]